MIYIIIFLSVFYWIGCSLFVYISLSSRPEKEDLTNSINLFILSFLWPILVPIAIEYFVSFKKEMINKIKILEKSHLKCINFKLDNTGFIPECIPNGWIISCIGQNTLNGAWSCSLIDRKTWNIVISKEHPYMSEAIEDAAKRARSVSIS